MDSKSRLNKTDTLVVTVATLFEAQRKSLRIVHRATRIQWLARSIEGDLFHDKNRGGMRETQQSPFLGIRKPRSDDSAAVGRRQTAAVAQLRIERPVRGRPIDRTML